MAHATQPATQPGNLRVSRMEQNLNMQLLAESSEVELRKLSSTSLEADLNLFGVGTVYTL